MLHVTYKNLNLCVTLFCCMPGISSTFVFWGSCVLTRISSSPSCCAQGLALSQLPTVSQGLGNPPKNRQMNTNLLIIIHNMGGEVSHHYRSRSPTLTQRIDDTFPMKPVFIQLEQPVHKWLRYVWNRFLWVLVVWDSTWFPALHRQKIHGKKNRFSKAVRYFINTACWWNV